MTLSQDIIACTVPGRVYTPPQVAEMVNFPRSSNVKKVMDNLCEYHIFDRWEESKKWNGHEVYAYLRMP